MHWYCTGFSSAWKPKIWNLSWKLSEHITRKWAKDILAAFGDFARLVLGKLPKILKSSHVKSWPVCSERRPKLDTKKTCSLAKPGTPRSQEFSPVTGWIKFTYLIRKLTLHCTGFYKNNCLSTMKMMVSILHLHCSFPIFFRMIL